MKRQGLLPMPVGRWEKQVAVVPFKGGTVRIDTEKKRISFQPDERGAKRHAELAKENILLDQPLAGGRYRVRVRVFEREKKGDSPMRFELFDAKAKTTASLTGFVAGYPGCMLSASPDRKHVAILYAESKIEFGKPADWTVRVIRADGKVVATFHVK